MLLMSLLSAWKLHDEIILKRPNKIYRTLYLGFSAFIYSLAGTFVTILTIFHCYLIASQLTTYEFLKRKYQFIKNPYDQGVLRNVASFIWRGSSEKQVNLEYLTKFEETDATTA